MQPLPSLETVSSLVRSSTSEDKLRHWSDEVLACSRSSDTFCSASGAERKAGSMNINAKYTVYAIQLLQQFNIVSSVLILYVHVTFSCCGYITVTLISDFILTLKFS